MSRLILKRIVFTTSSSTSSCSSVSVRNSIKKIGSHRCVHVSVTNNGPRGISQSDLIDNNNNINNNNKKINNLSNNSSSNTSNSSHHLHHHQKSNFSNSSTSFSSNPNLLRNNPNNFTRRPPLTLKDKIETAVFKVEHEASVIQSVEELQKNDETLQSPDYFQVYNLFTIKDLFDARVHMGHKVGSMNERMRPFIFGSRFDSLIIDLDQTAFLLRQALNFIAHLAYRKGIFLFITRSPQVMNLVEKTAFECGEYAHTREWSTQTLTNATKHFGGMTRLPDTVIFLNTLDTVLNPHGAVTNSAKLLIPSVGIVDTNCDPNLITYPIPGNDDTQSAVELYCKLFKEAILRGKNKRKLEDSKAAAASEAKDVNKQNK